jgi:hypothetical protein
MELEHLFQQTMQFTILQMIFMTSLYIAEQMGKGAMVRSFVRTAASAVVNAGPMSLLIYILVQVNRLA